MQLDKIYILHKLQWKIFVLMVKQKYEFRTIRVPGVGTIRYALATPLIALLRYTYYVYYTST
jgi:hypothetical protein